MGGGGGPDTPQLPKDHASPINIYIKGNKRFRKVSINKYTYT